MSTGTLLRVDLIHQITEARSRKVQEITGFPDRRMTLFERNIEFRNGIITGTCALMLFGVYQIRKNTGLVGFVRRVMPFPLWFGISYGLYITADAQNKLN